VKFATKPIWHYLQHFRHDATLSWEIKNSKFMQIFSRYGRKCKQIAFWVHRSFCQLSGEATKNTFSSIKTTKSAADYGNFGSRSLARLVRAAQFTSVSSCARRLLKHFRRNSLQIIWDINDRWTPVFRDISRTVLWVCGLSSWLKTKLLTLLSQRYLQCEHCALPDHLSTVPVSRNFFNSLLTPRFAQPFSEN